MVVESSVTSPCEQSYLAPFVPETASDGGFILGGGGVHFFPVCKERWDAKLAAQASNPSIQTPAGLGRAARTPSQSP